MLREGHIGASPQITNRKQVFARSEMDKGLIVKIFQGISAEPEKTGAAGQHWAKDVNSQFSKEEPYQANKHTKRCPEPAAEKFKLEQQ